MLAREMGYPDIFEAGASIKGGTSQGQGQAIVDAEIVASSKDKSKPGSGTSQWDD
jgi:hypothetical protein